MENAVKALLIAAAVLIAVLIISLVMGVFNTGSEQVENAGDLSEYQIQEHNNKFTQYEGSNKTAAEVNALLTTVFTHNVAQDDTTTCVQVVTGTGTETEVLAASNTLTAKANKVSSGARYTVKCTFDSTTGLVTKVSYN